MIQVKTFYFNELRECTYVLWDETCACVVVDPGAESDSERRRLQQFIADNGLRPEAILNTHGHFDHVLGNAFLARVYGIKSYIHAGDRLLLEKTNEYGSMFGYKIEQPPAAAGFLTEDEPFCFGPSQLQVLHTPGHSKGGVCFYAPADKFVLTGDTLFQGNIGRVDLPGGDFDEIMESLSKKLMLLPDDTVVYPGHGLPSTIGEEKRSNPYVAEIFC
ncbi:MAG: MBL fold metallo-hydrolase [Prevotellaceae bacterium]|jgi:glyoxylase-like metal-dependent hydrolase (beta-lactamase superfamily II)|nr:MBL fold metallo-hydrolase [Prevotellaceae bacterium]